MVDILKAELLPRLDPHPLILKSINLPFKAFVTDNMRAFRYHIENQYRRAFEEDKEFAYAYLAYLRTNLNYRGVQNTQLIKFADEGIKRIAKLPNHDQLWFRINYYLA